MLRLGVYAPKELDEKFEGRDYSSFTIAESAIIPASSGPWSHHNLLSVSELPVAVTGVAFFLCSQAASRLSLCAEVLIESLT